MLNDNAKKWVAALRSGEYEQGTNALNKNGKMCCLGVACEIAIKYGVSLKIGYYCDANIKTYDGETGILPSSVRDWLGLYARDGESQHAGKLTIFNDSGKTFSEIADIIESEPKGLFV